MLTVCHKRVFFILQEFPGSPVVKTGAFTAGPGFKPSSGNSRSTSHGQKNKFCYVFKPLLHCIIEGCRDSKGKHACLRSRRVEWGRAGNLIRFSDSRMSRTSELLCRGISGFFFFLAPKWISALAKVEVPQGPPRVLPGLP